MAQIAAGAGLQQSSLYYYFRSKEEILAALVAKANVVPLRAGPPGARRGRGRRPCGCTASCAATSSPCAALPFDINEVHRFAARDRERFADVLEGAAHAAVARLAAIVREGIADGSLRAGRTPGSPRSR